MSHTLLSNRQSLYTKQPNLRRKISTARHGTRRIAAAARLVTIRDRNAALSLVDNDDPALAKALNAGQYPLSVLAVTEQALFALANLGAQILLDLGVREMILLSTAPQTIVGLDGYGLTVKEVRDISSEAS